MSAKALAMIWMATSLFFCGCGGISESDARELEAERLFKSGLMRFEKREYAKAKADFEKALTLAPGDAKVENALVWVRQLLKEDVGVASSEAAGAPGPEGPAPDPAARSASDALTPEFREAYQSAVDAYRRGDLDAMLEAAQRAMSLLDPNSPVYEDMAIQFAQALIQSGDYDEGATWTAAMLEQNPDNLALLSMGTVSSERAGDLGQALAFADRAYQLSPDTPEFQNNLAYTYAVSGQNLESAYELSARSLAAMPNSPAYLDTMGWVLYQMGDPEAALGYLEQALSLMPDGQADPAIFEHYRLLIGAPTN